jgi:hypothetical protein
MSLRNPQRQFSGAEFALWYLCAAAVAAIVAAITAGLGLHALSGLKIGCQPVGGDLAPGDA